MFTWSRRSTNLRLSTLKKKHNNKQKNTKQQVGRPKVPLHGEKRWFLARRWSQPCLFPSRTASCFPPSFATPADTPSLVGLRSAASQEGHKQSNSEPLLIKLLPNPVTRKAQPWHVSLHRDLAREPPQPPAAQQLRGESRGAAALTGLGGETGKQGPKSAPNLSQISPSVSQKGPGSLPRPAPPTPRPFCCFCCCIPPRPRPLDTTSSFTMSMISSGMRRYLMVLPRM